MGQGWEGIAVDWVGMQAPRGYTLIELLVVVVIIGILVLVASVGLSTAQKQGDDAAVKGDLASIQVQASQYYSSKLPGSFGSVVTTCTASGSVFTDSSSPVYKTVNAAITHASASTRNRALTCKTSCVNQAGTADSDKCASGATNAYLVAGQLSNGKYWCVDSRQAAREVTSIGSANLCPAS